MIKHVRIYAREFDRVRFERVKNLLLNSRLDREEERERELMTVRVSERERSIEKSFCNPVKTREERSVPCSLELIQRFLHYSYLGYG